MTCPSCGGRFTAETEGTPVCVGCAFSLSLTILANQEFVTPRPEEELGTSASEGLSVGRYRIRRILGEGGMGHVYEATEDDPAERRVALKLLKLGVDSASILARFEAERQALALMSHPNIAQAYDAGFSADGRPYFAMEYVEGPWITDHCDAMGLAIRERLDLFLEVCRGIQHAHQRGVIHRDIKPSNILVQTEAGRSIPKIIDFGVAKATGADLGGRARVTKIGQLVGTPEYMSPEQAGLASFDVDTRSDVYSLGVLLYELLTGRLPFELSPGDEDGLRRRIREEDAPTCTARLAALGPDADQVARARGTDPSSLRKQVRHDLDWITAKALEKDRTRRYGSPAQLAEDIVRHLENEPVLAGPPTAAYRARKFVRRHRMGVTTSALGALAVLAFAATMTVQARRIAAEREASNRVSEFLRNVLGSVRPKQMGIALWKDLHDSVAALRRNGGASPAEIDAVLASLDETLAGLNPTDTARRLLDQQLLAPAGEAIERETGADPLVSGRLEDILGMTYWSYGLLPQAEHHAQRSVAIRTAAFGAEESAAINAQITLALIYTDQGRTEEAEALGRRTLEARRRLRGDDDENVLWLVNSLGGICALQNRWEEAEPFFRQAMDGFERVHGPHHWSRLMVMGNLIAAYDRLDRLDEAEKTGLEVLELTRDHLDDNYRLGAMDNLANVYLRQGRYQEAEKLHREALEAQRSARGLDHPNTLRTMHNLANDLEAAGRLDEAETLLRDVIEARRRVLPADHPFTSGSLYSLASVRKKLGHHGDAAKLLHEVYESRRRALRPDDPDMLDTMYAIGAVAALQGDRETALHWLRETVEHGYKDHGDGAAMSQDDDLKSLRGDPVFEALAVRSRKAD